MQQCVCQLLTNLKCRFHIPDWLRDANFETSRALEKEVDKNVYTRNKFFEVILVELLLLAAIILILLKKLICVQPSSPCGHSMNYV